MERGFKEQYERMLRSYEKCIAHSQWGDEPKLPYYGFEKDIQIVEDDFIHFFQDCLSLRDWITKDPSVPKRKRNIVNKYYQVDPELRWARDLANATKHLKLDPKRASVSEDMDIERVGIGYTIGSAPIGVPPYSRLYVGIRSPLPSLGISRLVGENNGLAIEAEELAMRCKASIDKLLRTNKLL